LAWREIKQGAVDLEKLHGLLAMVPEVENVPDAKVLAKPQGRVTFEDVSFNHEGRSVGVQNISFDVPAGGKIAFVGTSGAGKSTLLKLLFRFYDTDGGRVLVDGQDVRTVTQESLRAALGLVPQDVVLFNDTIRANIAYARPSALDSATEAAVQDALEHASAGRTTLMVAHRLSTVISADEIIVLEAGRVIERGNHAALLAKGGKYADMWQRQARSTDAALALT
jgi:ABC-type transport system involved in Fe-S cluster assembly fused permease/ATPase subunit